MKNFSDSVQYQAVLSNLEKNNGQLKCAICGKTLASKSECHFNHVVPASEGKDTNGDNCQILCTECHEANRSREAQETYSIEAPQISKNMLLHMLLLTVFGIMWLALWVYKVTDSLNRVKELPSRSPTKTLLYYVLIPFYSVYWFYKMAKCVEYLTERAGARRSFSGFCTLLALFFPPLASLFLQLELERISQYTFSADSCEDEVLPEAKNVAQNEYKMSSTEERESSSFENENGEVKLLCPRCQKTLRFPAESLGKKRDCPFCYERFTVQRP
ncbi:MAG: HNH endonuclease [Clostridia bacterium]|nr:HNH endonuclease [Clostridia bacterium]